MTRRLVHLSKLTYLLDENVSVKTYNRLKSIEIDVKSVKSEKLTGTKNGDILLYCSKRDWILITHDQDFLSPFENEFYGIIVVKIHLAIDSVAGVILEKFLSTIDENKLIGKIVILEKNTWRFKSESK